MDCYVINAPTPPDEIKRRRVQLQKTISAQVMAW